MGVTPVMLSHDRFDCLRGLVGMIEWNRANIVVQHMGLNDPVKESPTDESKFSINGRRGTPGISPSRWGVVRNCGVGVLEEGDTNWRSVSMETF